MKEFLSTWYGITAFIVFDVVVIFAILAINYRFFCKRLLDILFSALAIVVTSPVLLGVAVAEKIHIARTNAYAGVLESSYRCGKDGKVICLYRFCTHKAIDGRVDTFGKRIRPLASLPLLWGVFAGALSFIGPMALPITDEMFVSDDDYLRFKARPGLINPLIVRGKNETRSYEKMFRADKMYAGKISLFFDLKIFFTFLLLRVRGNKENRLGVAADKTYTESLIEEQSITSEDLESAQEEEKRVLARRQKRKQLRRQMADK